MAAARAYARHGGNTGSMTHAYHWEYSVAIIQPQTGCFISANAKQAGHEFGDREKILGSTATCLVGEVTVQERFLMEWIPEHECVALRAFHDNFLSAPEDGLVHANQAAKTAFEHWRLVDVGGDADGAGGAGAILVGLQSAHGTYLNVDEAGNCVLASEPHGFLFLLNVHMGDTGANITNPLFQCMGVMAGGHLPVLPCAIIAWHSNFLYEDPATVGIECTRKHEVASDAAVFFIEVQAGDKVAIRTPQGLYVATNAIKGTQLDERITENSHWFLRTMPGRKLACFHGGVHGYYLCAEDGRVVCNRASPGSWAEFGILAGPRTGQSPKEASYHSTINFVTVTDHHLTGME